MRHRRGNALVPVLVLLALGVAPPAIAADAVRAIDQGRLRDHDGLPIVTLRGSPYEIGYQHGALLRDDVRAAVADVLTFARRRYVPVPLLGP